MPRYVIEIEVTLSKRNDLKCSFDKSTTIACFRDLAEDCETDITDVKELIDIMKEAGQEVPDWMVAEASR